MKLDPAGAIFCNSFFGRNVITKIQKRMDEEKQENLSV